MRRQMVTTMYNNVNNCLAAVISVLTALHNSFEVGPIVPINSFDLIALIFSASRLCMLSFKSAVIPGDFLDLMRLMRIRTCLSTICKNFVFHSVHIWLGRRTEFKNLQFLFLIWLRNLASLKSLKVSLHYWSVALSEVNQKFTKCINKTMIL